MSTSTKGVTWAPIRKVVVGALASAAVYVAHRYLGLDIASEAVEEALVPAVGFVAAWAVKDPRVATVVDELEESELAAQIEDMILDELAKLEK